MKFFLKNKFNSAALLSSVIIIVFAIVRFLITGMYSNIQWLLPFIPSFFLLLAFKKGEDTFFFITNVVFIVIQLPVAMYWIAIVPLLDAVFKRM